MLVLRRLPWLFQLSDSDRVTSLLLVSILVLFALFPSVLHLQLPLFPLRPKSATGTSFRHAGKRKCCLLLLLSPSQEMLLPLQPALVMVPCGSVHNNVITHTLLHPSFHAPIFLSHHSTFITAPSFLCYPLSSLYPSCTFSHPPFSYFHICTTPERQPVWLLFQQRCLAGRRS